MRDQFVREAQCKNCWDVMANDVLSTDDNHVITVDVVSNVTTQNAYHDE